MNRSQPALHSSLLGGTLPYGLPTNPSPWPTAILCLFSGVSLLAAGVTAAGLHWRWLDLAVFSLAALAALAALSHRLPLQNIATIGAIALLFSGIILGCTIVSAFPLGPLRFTDQSGPLMFGKVPVAALFCWLAILASSRETARLILLPWRRRKSYGFGIVAVATALVLITNLNWEPFGGQAKGFWFWGTQGQVIGWYAAPWSSFLGWAVGTVVILGFSTPWFISKRPAASAPRLHAALVWGLLNLQFITGNAAKGLWLAVAAGGVPAAAAAALAWREARAGQENARPASA
jgi:hypothetical protein